MPYKLHHHIAGKNTIAKALYSIFRTFKPPPAAVFFANHNVTTLVNSDGDALNT